MNNPTQSVAWNKLIKLSEQFRKDDFRLSELFVEGDRFVCFSLEHEDLLLDYSKNFITQEIMKTLRELAENMQLHSSIESMFSGGMINPTEKRAALHTALRIPEKENAHTEVTDCLNKMESFVGKIHSGEWKGHSGQQITDIVNLGIGGSDLGPSLICDALHDYALNIVTVHFVSNIDPSHLDDTLKNLNPKTTLFVVASKSFTTLETHQNALVAKEWIMASAKCDTAIQKHFIAVTTNSIAAKEFGINEENLYPIWDWVGGRYSLWSAIGISIALSIGMTRFKELLSGAHSMDTHFRSTAFDKNLPVIMALLTIWYTGFLGARSSALTPYSYRLQKLPAYAQQLYMESLGKSITKDDQPVATRTGEVLWGASGTNGQHSYFQFLHQGTELIPVDFIAFVEPTIKGSSAKNRHQHLLCNCFSQSHILMKGTPKNELRHKAIRGNKPSNTLLIRKLNPHNIGTLLALYEHKTFVQSIVWNINAFDQWGVEFGKAMSEKLFDTFTSTNNKNKFDSSTQHLIEFVKK